MTSKPPGTAPARDATRRESEAARKQRLAAELRSNLAKRKAQARARSRGSQPGGAEGRQDPPDEPGT